MPSVTKQTAKLRARGRTGSVVKRIAPACREERGVKINLYGRSGTGKTTLSATFPKPLLHLVCSGVGLGESLSIGGVKGVDDIELRDSEEVRALAEYVAEGNHYKTVVLDHATGFQDLVLREILGLIELPAQKSWGMASREQYGQCSLKTKEYFRLLLNLDCHVVIIAQEREFNTEGATDSLMPFVASALTPSVAGWLNPACNYICQTFIRQPTKEQVVKVAGKRTKVLQKLPGAEYCLRTAPNPIYTTKFRLPKGSPLPDVIVDPDFKKVERLIRQGG